MKRYRYNKLKPEDIQEIKELRKEGLTFKEIASRFNVAKSTIGYHSNEEYKKKNIKRAMKSWNKKTEEQKKERYRKNKEYFKEYLKDRYHNDPEFRKRYIRYQIKSQRKRKEALKLEHS